MQELAEQSQNTPPQEQSKARSDFLFYKNLALLVVFFVLTPLTIAATLFSLVVFDADAQDVTESQIAYNSIERPQSGVQVYAALPDTKPGVTAEAETADARVEIVRQYLERYNSPLEPYADTLVEAADQNELDFRLVTAIAQQESNLCKVIPHESYNCWGWGIHSAGTLGFEDYEAGIYTVSRGLKKNYIDKGYVTPEDIMSKYTPHSDGSWARGVTEFMEAMQ